MQIGADLIKIYVKARREKNHDGDRLLRVIADNRKIKNYTFTVKVDKNRR